MKKKFDFKHLKAVLAICFLLLIPLQLLAKDITVYFRDVNNDKLSCTFGGIAVIVIKKNLSVTGIKHPITPIKPQP